MKKIIDSINRKILVILVFLIGVFISSGMVFAATKYFSSSDVEYSPSLSGLKSANLQDAMNELYNYCTISKNTALASMCPGCVYAFPTTKWYYNTQKPGNNSCDSFDRPDISGLDYKTDYHDLIAETGKEYFIGIVFDNDAIKISRVFTCGLITKANGNKVPFCIEASLDSDCWGGKAEVISQAYNKNDAIIKYLFNNNCTESDGFVCTSGNIKATYRPGGNVAVGTATNSGNCWADNHGQIQCS